MCFLWFTRSQKRYKCFSVLLNRYFIYADVTFTESSFYFKFSSSLVSSYNQTHISIVCDSPVMSNVPTELPPSPPLKVYSRHQSS